MVLFPCQRRWAIAKVLPRFGHGHCHSETVLELDRLSAYIGSITISTVPSG
jgi:hypothetical protein